MTNIQGRKSGGSKPSSPKESPDSLHSVATAKILLALSEGECAGGLTDKDIYLDGTPIRAQDGTLNFPGVTWEYRSGTQAQEYIQGIPSVENEITVNTPLKQTQSWTRAISNTQLSALRIRLGLPALQKQKDNGDVVGSRVEYKIELSTDGTGYQTVVNGAFDGKTTSLYERSHRIDLPVATTGWQVRVTRITADSVSNRIADATNIEAYAEVIDAKLRYPNSELLFVTFDAKQFSNIPQISVKAPGRLIRVPTTYDPLTRTYSGTWDGSFKWAYSNNPAWVFYDIILNPRFGLGDRLDASQVDKWELYRIAQYCDQLVPDGLGGSGTEPRFLCDVFIQSQNEAFNVLRDLASVFRGMTYWANNQLVALADQPRDMTYIYTRANVIDGKFVYAGGSERNRYSTAMVSWSNPDNHYADEVEAVVEQDLVRRYGVRQTEITAIGCIRRTEANRRGRWILLSNAKDRLVTFSTGLEGMIPLPGHIIGVADQNLSGRVMGGRVSAVSGRVITLDRVADAKAGDRLMLNLPSGTSQARTIQNVTDKVVTVTTAYSETPEAEAVWSVDADDLFVQQYRVTGITDNDDGTFTIAAINHNPDKYAAIDSGARLDERPISAIPPGVIAPPGNVRIDSYSRVVQNISVETMRVTWDAVPNAVAYECEWRKDNGDWVNSPRTSSLGFEVSGIYSGRYMARVRAINSSDISSIWMTSLEIELTGKVGQPPMPVNFRTSSLLWGIQLDWSFPADTADTLQTEVQYSTVATGANPMLLTDVPYPQHSYTQMGLKAGISFWYRARLVDRIGNQSVWTAWLNGQATSEGGEYLDAIAADLKDTEAFKELNAGLKDLSTQTGELDSAIKKEVTDRQTAVSAEVTARGNALLTEKNERTADITRVDTKITTATENLAQQIAQISAGTGEQFDPLTIWYFDSDAAGWKTGAGTAPAFSNGWIKSTDNMLVSPVVAVSGNSYRFVKLRIKKTGTQSGATFKLEWKQGVETTFAHSVDIDPPTYDANGISVVAIPDIGWGAVTQFRIVASVQPTATDYIEVDWVAVGRPTPGAGMAALQAESTARSDAIASEANSRETLATQMRGPYTGGDIEQVSTGLLGAERQARVTADTAQVKATQELKATVGDNTASISDQLISNVTNALANNTAFRNQRAQTAHSDASISRIDTTMASDKEALAQSLTDISARFDGNEALIRDESTARADADSAMTRQISEMKTTVGKHTSSITQINQTVTDNEQSTAQAINQVKVEAEGASAGVQSNAEAIVNANGRVDAIYSLSVVTESNGVRRVSGMVLAADGTQSSMLMSADTFAVYNPSGGGQALVFAATGGQLFIRDAFIQNGSITNAKIGDYIQSLDYISGLSGWSINKNGAAEFNKVTVRGTIYAIDGWFKGTVYAGKIEGDIGDFIIGQNETRDESGGIGKSMSGTLFSVRQQNFPTKAALISSGTSYAIVMDISATSASGDTYMRLLFNGTEVWRYNGVGSAQVRSLSLQVPAGEGTLALTYEIKHGGGGSGAVRTMINANYHVFLQRNAGSLSR